MQPKKFLNLFCKRCNKETKHRFIGKHSNFYNGREYLSYECEICLKIVKLPIINKYMRREVSIQFPSK